MDESNRSQENAIPNIHVPANEKVLAYLKDLHPYHEIILPFSAKKVNQDTTPLDFIGRFSSMPSLPENSKYVIYGRETLVHPKTGIIFGFITGTRMIFRLPDEILEDVEENNINNFRAVNAHGPDTMRGLENNWVSSPSITEQLVYKCFEYYGQTSQEHEEVHLNFDLDLTTPRTREFEEQERSRRLLPLAMLVIACILIALLWYAANSVFKFL
ncbi:MAG TPA: hypothetical protein VK206_12335 [Anaerolineales bacterium]|nr:hypothetical protein [Anaerolineales bacterium]HLO33298.1 hypothetical protein [Anaerolineales bacterium]